MYECLLTGKKIGENISENDFVQVLSKKVQGTLTYTSTEKSDAYEAASPLQKVGIFALDQSVSSCNRLVLFLSSS